MRPSKRKEKAGTHHQPATGSKTGERNQGSGHGPKTENRKREAMKDNGRSPGNGENTPPPAFLDGGSVPRPKPKDGKADQ